MSEAGSAYGHFIGNYCFSLPPVRDYVSHYELAFHSG